MFKDGNVFWAVVQANAYDGSLPLYSEVRSAHSSDHGFKVMKDKWRGIYEVDRWKVYTLYYCQ